MRPLDPQVRLAETERQLAEAKASVVSAEQRCTEFERQQREHYEKLLLDQKSSFMQQRDILLRKVRGAQSWTGTSVEQSVSRTVRKQAREKAATEKLVSSLEKQLDEVTTQCERLENDAAEKKVEEKSRRTLYRRLALEREANAEHEAEKKELETACRKKDDIIAAQDSEIEGLVWQINNMYSDDNDNEGDQSLILCRDDLENPEFRGYPNRVKFCFVQLMSLGISGDVAHKGARIILDAYAPHLPEDLEVPRPSTLDGWRESLARAGRVCAGVHVGNPAVTKIMHGEDGSTKENMKVATSVLTLLTGHRGTGSFRHVLRTLQAQPRLMHT
jgi:hypothetical protein